MAGRTGTMRRWSTDYLFGLFLPAHDDVIKTQALRHRQKWLQFDMKIRILYLNCPGTWTVRLVLYRCLYKPLCGTRYYCFRMCVMTTTLTPQQQRHYEVGSYFYAAKVMWVRVTLQFANHLRESFGHPRLDKLELQGIWDTHTYTHIFLIHTLTFCLISPALIYYLVLLQSSSFSSLLV